MGWPRNAVLATMASAAIGLTAAAASVPEADNIDELQLEQDRFGRFTVAVTIGDEGPFNFMIDTASQATLLSSDLADQLMLRDRRTARLIGVASKEMVEVASIDDLTLGSRMFDIPIAPLVPRANIGRADGILGLDTLQQQRVLIDFIKGTIAVADASELGGNRGYEVSVKARRKLGQLIITDAVLDGVKVAVIVDTGSEASIGNMALLERLGGRTVSTNLVTDINGQGISATIRQGKILTIDRLHINNIPILLADAPTFHALGLADEPALILGLNELKLFRRVAIDFNERRVLFDLPRSVREFDSMIGGRMGL